LVYNKRASILSPDKDAGWGLIFRLNSLWAKVDIPAEAGDYDTWNTLLDRIFCNLLYRNKMEIVKDESGKIIGMVLKEEPYEIFKYLSTKVFKSKLDYNRSLRDVTLSPVQRNILKSRWYQAVMFKDIWLRKFMQELGLYLKEIEKSPGSALFGGN
jgi:hypothetical protein